MGASDDEPLIWRPDNSHWFLIGIWWALGIGVCAMLIFGNRPRAGNDTAPMLAVLGLFFALPVIGGCWAMVRLQTIAVARGLTFVGFLRTRKVNWAQISDFSWESPSSSSSKSGAPRAFIEVDKRKISVPNDPVWRRRIEGDAKNAKVRQFGNRATRDDSEWPKTFVYHDQSGWKLVAIYLAYTFTLAALMFLKAATYGWNALISKVSLLWNGFSFWEKVGFVTLGWMICGSMGLVILAQYPAILTQRKWLQKSVVATREKLIFRDENGEIAFDWDEISDFHLESLPGHLQRDLCVVQTRRERREFLGSISQSKILRLLIGERAINADEKKNGVTNRAPTAKFWAARAVCGAAPTSESDRKSIITHAHQPHHAHFRRASQQPIWVRPTMGVVRGGVWIAPQTEDW